MPIYKNITSADLYLESEQVLGPSRKIEPDETFNGSKFFYDKYTPDLLLQRQTDGHIGESEVTTGPDALTVNVEGFIKKDSIDARAADAAINTEITAGNNYSAFGFIRWTDAGTEYEAPFSITGDGTHGTTGEAVFSIGSPTPGGPGQQPTEAGSVIDCAAGTISFAMTGAGAIFPEVEVIYEISDQANVASQTNQFLAFPNYTTSYTYVNSTDTNGGTGTVNYVNGSGGSIKTKKVFYTGSKVGDPCVVTTYYYQDTANATKATHQIEERAFVTASDLG